MSNSAIQSSREKGADSAAGLTDLFEVDRKFVPSEKGSLTKEEAAWCKALEKLLLSTPARLGLHTVGDRNLHVFDQAAVNLRKINIADGGAERAGLQLGLIRSSVCIHSLSG